MWHSPYAGRLRITEIYVIVLKSRRIKRMFSAIIPLYNKKRYIRRALDSVINQSVQPVEIIVVDDGSTDGGADLVKQRSGSRIIILQQGNRGVSVARNVGLKSATGNHVAFLDADDEWNPDFLLRMRELISVFPEAGLYGSGFETCADGHSEKSYLLHSKNLLPRIEDNHLGFGPVDYFSALLKNDILCSSSIVVDKAKALAMGGFPEGVSICEDYEFWIQMALNYDVVVTPEVLACYHTDASGTAKDYWQSEYKVDFPVLHIHRFLVEKYQNHAELKPSFAIYCRKLFTTCLLQRIYNRRFDAAFSFYDELGLQDLNLGWRIRSLGLFLKFVKGA